MSVVLSILIPSTYSREKMLADLVRHLQFQIFNLGAEDKVEIILDIDNGTETVGKKRNNLLAKANGYFSVSVDSDDWVADNYIEKILKALEEEPDAVGFTGFMLTNGKNKENFKISCSLEYTTVRDENGKRLYLRFNNHLSPMRTEIARKIGFKSMRQGEDFDFAVRLKNSGLIKKEVFLDCDLYHYKFVTNKTY